MTQKTVLVIGGTGMLRPAVYELLDRGMKVVLVSRRPSRAAPTGDRPGEFVPVTADWRKPEALIDAVLMATDRKLVTHVIVWVHTPYRNAVVRQLERVVAPNAVVIHVWGSATQDPRDVRAAESSTRVGGASRDLLLGYVRDAGVSRWLSHAEISAGVLGALDRTGSVHVVGQIDPWDQRP